MLPVSARPEVADDLARLTPALLRALRRLLRLLPDEASPEHIQIVSIGPRANLDVYRRAAERLERR